MKIHFDAQCCLAIEISLVHLGCQLTLDTYNAHTLKTCTIFLCDRNINERSWSKTFSPNSLKFKTKSKINVETRCIKKKKKLKR